MIEYSMENFKEVEKRWQKFWEESSQNMAVDSNSKKNKKYILVEFPYPSGSGLHVGHAFSFTGGDVYARFKRMQGENVLFPMGWDAFGLPTENYAIKMKKKPQDVTKENTDMFRKQMKELAFSFDWSREVNTTDPNYYKWTQWIFIQLFNKGLAYKKEMPINWCPSCKIGLANEEVIDGKCERCGSEVSRRNISQWVVKITDYADRLIDGLKETNFIEKVKQAQINWIGKSEGAKINFKIKGKEECLEIFTTRPDTLPGVTFMVIAPEHELVNCLEGEEIKDYVKNARKKSDLERTELSKDKTGVFSGLYAINPLNNKEIPIWISDFVLATYGTGAIMAVPAHDERDNAFAKKFGLEIISVYDENNKTYDIEKEKGKMLEWIKEKGIGEGTANYHLRDWIFSRQHYWGEPIPMVKCPKCGWVPVNEHDLPIVLPEVDAYEPTDDGKSPLSKIESFVKTICPKCGGEAERETDTMPNWAGSDWYYLRYIDPFNDIEICSQELAKKWLPVDVYIGGDEHNTLHLLYSRFIFNFLYDIGVVPIKEPYYKRISHGVILGTDNQRMSKSRGNVIVPEVVADKYGVDVVRMYLMFMGPFDATMAWNENTLMGIKRFLDRFEKYVLKQIGLLTANSDNVIPLIHKTVDKVTRDLEVFGYNTAIAKLMEMINGLSVNASESIGRENVETIIKLIAPFAPYLAEELYFMANNKRGYNSVHIAEWPKAEAKYLVDEELSVAVAINGKVRDRLVIAFNKQNDKDEIINMAKELGDVKKWIGDKVIVKEVYVPGKMINFVIKD